MKENFSKSSFLFFILLFFFFFFFWRKEKSRCKLIKMFSFPISLKFLKTNINGWLIKRTRIEFFISLFQSKVKNDEIRFPKEWMNFHLIFVFLFFIFRLVFVFSLLKFFGKRESPCKLIKMFSFLLFYFLKKKTIGD